MVDVTVLGAGIFGLSVAWSCAKRGARVRVIDPNGVASGASGGIVGALAPHTPENWNDKKAFQLESLLMAEAYWADVADISGCDPGYARLGRLQPVADKAGIELARSRETSSKELWQGKAQWTLEHAPVKWAPRSPTGYVIRDTLSARIHPQQACAALAVALARKGVQIAAEGDWQGAVVHATGYAGLEEMTANHSRQVGNGVKGQAMLLALDARDAPQIFADTIHIVPHGDGTTAIGSTSEVTFEAPASTDALLDDIFTRAVAAVPLLAGVPVIAKWAGVRPKARSRAPMLGAHPFRPGQFVANGGFKIGFGVAPKVGEVMADLIIDGTDHIPPGFRAKACL